MGRHILIKYSEGAYHVTGRTNNKEKFPLPLKDCWNIFGYYLKQLQKKFHIKIYAFTLMNNHFHLLCSTPKMNLDAAMCYFMHRTSRGVGLASKKINHLYGSRYHWNYTDDPFTYSIIYKYILRNPVRAGICKNVDDYKWSTDLSNYFNFVLDSTELNEMIPTERYHEWINDSANIDERLIGKSLSKPTFKTPVKRSTRRKIDLSDYAGKKPKPK